MEPTPELTRGLRLLDALHQVQGERAVEETPEALADLLTQMCAQQSIVAHPEQISQAVALYRSQQATGLTRPLPVTTAVAQALAPTTFSIGWAAEGWWALSAVSSFMATCFLVDAGVGVFQGHGWLGIAADLMMVPPLAWMGLQGMERFHRRPKASRAGISALWDRLKRLPLSGRARRERLIPWEEGTWQHPMETQDFPWFRATSPDVFRLKSPYPGRQRMKLQVVHDPVTGQAAVALILRKGQFDVCSQIRVRFDDEEAQYWAVAERGGVVPLREAFPKKGRMLFLNEAATFLATLAQHDTVTLEVPFYDNGTRMIRFGTAGKGWSPREAWLEEAQLTRPPISRQWRVRPVLPEGISQWEVASDNTVWIEGRYNARFVRLECHVRHQPGETPATQVGFFLGEGGLQNATSTLSLEGRAERRTRLILEDTQHSPAELFSPFRLQEGVYAWLEEGADLLEAIAQGRPFSIDVVLREKGRATFTFAPPALEDLAEVSSETAAPPPATALFIAPFVASSTVDPAWWHASALDSDLEDDEDDGDPSSFDFDPAFFDTDP